MRPLYHYAPAANWLSDPNGLVYAHGQWHLFYQYNPQGEDWGHMSWGHAVSPDLAQWHELPVALAEDDQNMIFSGSAVVDSEGSAGFGRGALVAIYTAAAVRGPQNQSQAIAHSTDQGLTWEKYAGNPVIDLGMADFRDPNVFWHAPSSRWIMVVVLSNENRALIYGSHDLKQWDELSGIAGTGAPGRIWECPLLIELPIEGSSEARWLFKVDVLQDGPGSGAIYQTGTFDGTRFTPDGPELEPLWQLADHGSDFYAAIAWPEPRDEAGRPVWIGWIGNHAYQGQMPQQGWRGAMSLPRRISFQRSGDRLVLRQVVEPAAVAAVVPTSPDALRCAAATRITLPDQQEYSLSIADQAGRMVLVEGRGGLLLVTRRDPVSPFLDAVHKVQLSSDAALTLWLDHGSAELLGDDGASVTTVQHRLAGAELALRLT